MSEEELPPGGMWLKDWRVLKWASVNELIQLDKKREAIKKTGNSTDLMMVDDEIRVAIKTAKDVSDMMMRGDVYEST